MKCSELAFPLVFGQGGALISATVSVTPSHLTLSTSTCTSYCFCFSFVVNFVVTARGGFTRFYFLSAARSLVWGCVALSVVAVPLPGPRVAPGAWVAAVLCGWLLVKVLLGLSAVPGAIVGSRCCIQNERKFALDTVWSAEFEGKL